LDDMLEEVEEEGRSEVHQNPVGSKGDAVRASRRVGGSHYGASGEVVGGMEDRSTVEKLVEVESVEEGVRGEGIVGVLLPQPPPEVLDEGAHLLGRGGGRRVQVRAERSHPSPSRGEKGLELFDEVRRPLVADGGRPAPSARRLGHAILFEYFAEKGQEGVGTLEHINIIAWEREGVRVGYSIRNNTVVRRVSGEKAENSDDGSGPVEEGAAGFEPWSSQIVRFPDGVLKRAPLLARGRGRTFPSLPEHSEVRPEGNTGADRSAEVRKGAFGRRGGGDEGEANGEVVSGVGPALDREAGAVEEGSGGGDQGKGRLREVVVVAI
jgi:hypothetical protein